MRYTVLGALAESSQALRGRTEGGQRGESNTVDAHNTTVSLESQMHESIQEYLDSTSMFVVRVSEPAAAAKVRLLSLSFPRCSAALR